jgi:hypothetical protein
MWPNPYFAKISVQLLPWIKVAQNFGLLLYFSDKSAQRKQSPDGRKFAKSGHPAGQSFILSDPSAASKAGTTANRKLGSARAFHSDKAVLGCTYD